VYFLCKLGCCCFVSFNVSSKRIIMMIKFRLLLMQKLYSVLLVALVLCMFIPYVWAAQIGLVDDIETRFHQFVVEYNRTYARNSTEYAKRLAIFAVSSAGSLCVDCIACYDMLYGCTDGSEVHRSLRTNVLTCLKSYVM